MYDYKKDKRTAALLLCAGLLLLVSFVACSTGASAMI